MHYLLEQGYRCIPVRPRDCDEVLGVPCVTSLAEIDEPIDLVDVFRRPEFCADVVSLTQEEAVGGVLVFVHVVVAEAHEKVLELAHVVVWHFESREHTAEVGAVIPVVEQADVPAAAELFEELHQRAGALGEFEAG